MIQLTTGMERSLRGDHPLPGSSYIPRLSRFRSHGRSDTSRAGARTMGSSSLKRHEYMERWEAVRRGGGACLQSRLRQGNKGWKKLGHPEWQGVFTTQRWYTAILMNTPELVGGWLSLGHVSGPSVVKPGDADQEQQKQAEN
jgi:hypothetical protein